MDEELTAAMLDKYSGTDAERYRFLRERDLDTIDKGGIFVGITPDNLVLNGDDLDMVVDLAIETARQERQS